MPEPNADPAFLAAVAGLATELDLRLIDATGALDDASYFYDGVHLNAAGASKLATFIGRQLGQT
jgi:hypothetical protein